MHVWCAHCYNIATVPHVAYAMSVTKQHTFLQDLSAVERFFTVAKRIALFLARTSSQPTIDHLVYEISQQISEDGEMVPAALGADTGVRYVFRIDPHEILTIQAALRADRLQSPVAMPCSLPDRRRQPAWAAGMFSTFKMVNGVLRLIIAPV